MARKQKKPKKVVAPKRIKLKVQRVKLDHGKVVRVEVPKGARPVVVHGNKYGAVDIIPVPSKDSERKTADMGWLEYLFGFPPDKKGK